MPNIPFYKVQGTGNDFVLIDAQGLNLDWPGLARRMCSRHFGVGGDGLLVLNWNAGRFHMRMFNPDGSEAEACGNGLRCVGVFLLEQGLADGNQIPVDTVVGVRVLHPLREGGRLRGMRVGMGQPRLAPGEIPVALPGREGPILNYPLEIDGRLLELSFVSMGNPHAVCFIEGPVAAFPLLELGPRVEHHPLFPQRVNFEVVRVLGQGRLEARVWERGAGETLSCGSGACAIGVAARLGGKASGPVEITLPGGSLRVAWEPGQEVELSGPAEIVFYGEWADERER